MKPRGVSSSLRQPAAMEKRRRDQMKELYSKLAFMLHLQYERNSLPALLDQAAVTLQQWKERVEQLRARKENLENELQGITNNQHNLPVVQVNEMGSNLEVNLIIKSKNKKVELSEVVSIIQQGGADVISCSFSSLDQHLHYTIHAQAFQTRLGVDCSLIESKLNQLMYKIRPF